MSTDRAMDIAPTRAQESRTDASARDASARDASARDASARDASANEQPSHREIDQQLRRIAGQRAELDVEEARWLREAERQRVWRKLGFSTALEYLEDVYGYAPRTALERLRVAKELGELPGLEAELRRGAISWSAARELSRVMTRDTEAAWLARARGKNVHDIGRLVAGHKKGDDPDAPKDPELMTRRLLLELAPALDALFERTRLMFETERGEHLDDVALLEALCMRSLEPPPKSDGKAPRPIHRLVTQKCDGCLRAWREGRGRLVEISPRELAIAACDAELISGLAPAESIDDEDCTGAGGHESGGHANGGKRVRTKRRPPATLSIPKATRDFVWARDQGRCRVPGCRATRNLACHHLEFLSEGGDHDAPNIILICDGHHKVLHEGLLVITGRAPDELIFKRDGKLLVDGRSAAEQAAGDTLREQSRVQRSAAPQAHAATQAHGYELTTQRNAGESHALVRHGRNQRATRNRFDDVVKLEHAKQALMQLGFKARAARSAVEAACADVGAEADVASIVKAALQPQRRTQSAQPDDKACNIVADAKQALRQLGYPSSIADAAVESASAHVGDEVDLPMLIKEALQRCGGS